MKKLVFISILFFAATKMVIAAPTFESEIGIFITISEFSEEDKKAIKEFTANKKVTNYKSAYQHAKACYRDLQEERRQTPTEACMSYVMKRDGNLDLLAQWKTKKSDEKANPLVSAYYNKVEYEDASINAMSFSELDVKIDTGIHKCYTVIDDIMSQFRTY